MTTSDRVKAAWERIEAWLGANLPDALDNLRSPAPEAQLANLEQAVGRPLPEALRALRRDLSRRDESCSRKTCLVSRG